MDSLKAPGHYYRMAEVAAASKTVDESRIRAAIWKHQQQNKQSKNH
jgi:hypothetical protein